MSEIPKAPEYPQHEFNLVVNGFSLAEAREVFNKWIAAEWAKLFDGAEVVYGEGPDDVWGTDKVSDDRYSAILLKPVPIKKRGVTKREIDEAFRLKDSVSDLRLLLKRILDEGLADG